MSVRSLNKVLIIGNLTRDPNLRFTPNNNAVCSFGLATNRTWTPPDGGEKQERVEFHNIVAWGKLADICGQLLHKGDKVYVEGRLQTRDWKGDDGVERKTTEIVLENMIMLGGGRGAGGNYRQDDSVGDDAGSGSSGGGGLAGRSQAAQKSTPVSEPDDVTDIEDISDDVPF